MSEEQTAGTQHWPKCPECGSLMSKIHRDDGATEQRCRDCGNVEVRA